MNLKKTMVMVAVLAMMAPAIVSINGVSNVSAALPAQTRANTMWATGYDTKTGGSYYPFSGAPSYLLAFMYEPLFGFDAVHQKLIPVLGALGAGEENFTTMWSVDGKTLTVKINTDAKWSDGEDVTSEDVTYTYKMLMTKNCSRFTDDMIKKLKSVTADGDDKVVFTVNTGFERTLALEEWLTLDVPILPEHVWSEINADIKHTMSDAPGINEFDFKNNWLGKYTDKTGAEKEFPTDWKVTSGPYVPIKEDATAGEEVAALREGLTGYDDWWGKGKVHTAADLNKSSDDIDVKYVGIKFYKGNEGKDNALASAEVDMHAGAITDTKGFKVTEGDTVWYYGTEPNLGYVPLSGNIGLSFNDGKWPFNQQWLREAIAYAINRTAITTANAVWGVNKGNSILNPNNPLHVPYTEGVSLTDITQNLATATAKLKEHCYLKNDEWYVKTADCPADAKDDDKSEPGIQCKLQDKDGWGVMTPSGWGDTTIFVEGVVASLIDLGLDCYVDAVEFDPNWQQNYASGDFELGMQCCAPKTVEPAYTVLGGYRGTASPWNNETHWQGPEADKYEAAYQKFETANATARIELAKEMLETYSKDMPSILTHTNAIWHTCQTKYWTGWNAAWNQYNQLVPANTVNQMAAKCRNALALSTATGDEVYPKDMTPEALRVPEKPDGYDVTHGNKVYKTSKPSIPWFGLEIAAAIGVAAALILTLRKRN